MKYKFCPGCQRNRAVKFFSNNRAKPDGLGVRCKKCAKESQAAWYAKNHERHKLQVAARRKRMRDVNFRWLMDYLAAHPCVDCGETDPVVLDFDHVRGTKVHTISDLLQTRESPALVAAEVAKCQIRCANCHRRRTAEVGNWRRMFSR